MALTFTQPDVNVLPHERRRVWEAEAESLIERGGYHCARTVYQCLLKHYPTKKKVRMTAATLESLSPLFSPSFCLSVCLSVCLSLFLSLSRQR